jgi:hypothetical protein
MKNKAIIQWKIAMAQMQDANLVAAEIDPTKGTLTQRAARKIAEGHLDRYFELVEGETEASRATMVCVAISAPEISNGLVGLLGD